MILLSRREFIGSLAGVSSLLALPQLLVTTPQTGQREMALYLLDQGARVAAILGQLDVVKAFITAFPAMKDFAGSHKISLVRHAKATGARLV